MKRLLRIDASARRANSHSRALADYFEAAWRRAHPGGGVTTRDVAALPPPHLAEETIAVFYAGGDAGEGKPVPAGIALSDELIAELRAADDVVVSGAIYNFTLPSSLKAWIDHIVRFGHTLAHGERGAVGTLTGRSVCLLIARGGTPATSPEFATPALQALFRYLGFSRIDGITLEGTRIPDGRLDARIAAARAEIDARFRAP